MKEQYGKIFGKHLMKKPFYGDNTTAPGIIEEAVHLLRLDPFKLLLPYYIGGIPFILGLLYFWSDMSKNPFAKDYCSAASLGLACLFIWMKCWHSVFAIKIYESLGRFEPIRWSFLKIIRIVAVQTIIQPSGILMFPVALLITLPYPWVYAFYQNVLVQDYGQTKTIKEIIKDTGELTKYNPRQNIFVIFVLLLFQLFVLLNIAIIIYILPYLIKMLSGIETAATMGGYSYVNSTFLVTVVCLTYLCVDPLKKTIYVLRGFYGESIKTGKDLIADLNIIKSGFKKATLLTCFIILQIVVYTSISHATQIPAKQFNISAFSNIAPEELNSSIQEVLSRKEFVWKLPRDKKIKDTRPGIFDSFFKWLKPYWDDFKDTLKKWFDAIVKWLKNIMPDSKIKFDSEKKSQSSTTLIILYALLAIALILSIIYLIKIKLKCRKNSPEPETTSVITLDVSDETIRADALSTNQWLEMAKEFLEKGELRLAIRAFYLSTLSSLSEHSFISIAKYKSNKEYEYELARRAHENKEMVLEFKETVNYIDKIWYGMVPVKIEDIDKFCEIQNRIIGFAK